MKTGAGVAKLVGAVALTVIGLTLIPAASSAAPPANDNFAKAKVLSLKSAGSIRGTTVDATFQDSGPSHDAGSHGNRTASVWYRWKAISRQPVILSACSTTEPLRLAVYSGGSFDELKQVASSETGCPAGSKGGKLAIAPVAGVTYRIAVAAGLRDFQSAFKLSGQGPFLAPKNSYNLKGALRKCKKLSSARNRSNCARKARRQAAVADCQSILDSAGREKCVARARRR